MSPASPRTVRWILLGVLLGSCAAATAADAAKQARCAQYAQRAVQQFQLMSANPQCTVATDLRWQDNVDNHYNGCLMLPEFMSKSEEAARDNHLRACGGWAPPATAAAAPAAPVAGAAAATPAPVPADAATAPASHDAVGTGSDGSGGNGGHGSNGNGAVADATAPQDPVGSAIIPDSCDCALIEPGRIPALHHRQNLVIGTLTSVGGGTLNFTTPQGQNMSYRVVRPAFHVKEVQCGCIKKDIPAFSAWIGVDPATGPHYFEIQEKYGNYSAPVSSGNYAVISTTISNQTLRELTQIGPPPAPSGAKAAPAATTGSAATAASAPTTTKPAATAKKPAPTPGTRQGS
jgi:hypothetical protein